MFLTCKVLIFKPKDVINNTENEIYEGKIINSYWENNEEYYIILPSNEKGDIKQLRNLSLEKIKLLSNWNPRKLITLNQIFIGKFSRKKKKQLIHLLELEKEDPLLLIQYTAPYEKFFQNKNFYKIVIKRRLTKKIYIIQFKVKNVIKALLNLLLGDLFIYAKKYRQITDLEKKIHIEERAIKQYVLSQNEVRQRENKIKKYKEDIEGVKEKQQESSRGFTTLLISILTVFIYSQQCQIAKKQTLLQENQASIQEKQLTMERNLNLPKFNIYVSYSDDSQSENIYIKQINDAYLSKFLFQQSIVCQIKTKTNKTIFKRIIDYYNEALFPIEDKYGKYGLLGSGNVAEWNKIKSVAEGIVESIDIERIIKLSYTDYENNNHEQYFYVMPVLGADEWDVQLGEHFFDKEIEDLTMEQLLEYLKTMNTEQTGEDIIKQWNRGK